MLKSLGECVIGPISGGYFGFERFLQAFSWQDLHFKLSNPTPAPAPDHQIRSHFDSGRVDSRIQDPSTCFTTTGEQTIITEGWNGHVWFSEGIITPPRGHRPLGPLGLHARGIPRGEAPRGVISSEVCSYCNFAFAMRSCKCRQVFLARNSGATRGGGLPASHGPMVAPELQYQRCNIAMLSARGATGRPTCHPAHIL